tara:strand:+ start:336 stop:1268 length:933 start_codon:yes stop_codon:yes gene_type:complete
MNFGTIPRLDKKVSKLVIGNDYFKEYSQAEKLWDYYLANGGNTFDNSIYYKEGLTEKFLGKWIKSRNNEKEIVIISKVGNEKTKPSEIKDLLKISLERLKLNSIDILVLHRDNIDVPVDEILDSLNDLIDSKLIKIFGASNIGVQRIKKGKIWAQNNNKNSYEIINNNLSLATMIKPLWEGCISSNNNEYLNFLEKEKIPHFSWSSQARGFFIQESFLKRIFRKKISQKLKECFFSKENLERKKRAKDLSKKFKCSVNDIALAWVINQNFPSFAIIGPKNKRHLGESLKCFSISLSSSEIKWLNLADNNI